IRKLKAEKAENWQNEQLDRAVIEQQVREEVYAEMQAGGQKEVGDGASSAEVERLNGRIAGLQSAIEQQNTELAAKQARIDELTEILNNAYTSAPQNGEDTAELQRTVEEYRGIIKDKDNEINLLKAENSQIKAQALQKQLADRDRKDKEKEKEKAKPAAATTTRQAAKPEPQKQATADEDDEYDEYYDDYGDESSAVKVTLKFDRAKNSWIILRSDTDRTYRRMATKQDALVVAKDLAKRLHAQLVVHKKDGKFQKI
ncbi:MAG: DUF2188 domain-containing protein, partial [Clostridia bacterium]|nr:DUF2188 domain-containing protein [Clostridia bacterium]